MLRPKILVDLRTSRTRPFSPRPERVNLYRPRTLRIPLLRIAAWLACMGIGTYYFFGSVFAPIVNDELRVAAQSGGNGQNTTEERQALEKQLQDLEAQIAANEATIQTLKTQGKSLQSEINQLNAKVGKLNLQLKAVNLTLAKLNDEITDNASQITTTEGQIAFNRSALGKAVQNVYESDQDSLLEILLKSPNLSDFFGDVNNLVEIQGSLAAHVNRIEVLKGELLDEKEALALKKNDAETLKTYQDAQRRMIQSAKDEKAQILTVTKGKESKYQELLKQTQKTAAQIRSRIFELLGGGELTFEDAYKFAKFAEQATGVRAALILAVLDRESALGQNVGRCNYRTAMHPTRDIPLFLALTNNLNINPDTITVSCPNRDGLYGGAMGPAQFIPATWNLYADKIAGLTGSNPPSPWRNADAFMGTALFLKDAGAANASLAGERAAAAKYYAGARWRNFLWTYGDRVATRAQQFQQDINILMNG